VATSGEGMPIRAAAAMLGVSVNAVRKRINRETIEAHKDAETGEWRIILPDAATPRDLPRPARGDDIQTGERLLAATTPATPAALVIREAIAPFVADLKAAHERIGTLETELRIERALHAATLAALTHAEGQHEPHKHQVEQFPDPPTNDAHRAAQPQARGILATLRRWVTG